MTAETNGKQRFSSLDLHALALWARNIVMVRSEVFVVL
jgi:hypothetical protein